MNISQIENINVNFTKYIKIEIEKKVRIKKEIKIL